jgi:hypothetical protein
MRSPTIVRRAEENAMTWKTACLGTFATLVVASAASAQITVQRFDATTTSVSFDFATFEGGGFSTAPGATQLHSSNWRVLGLSAGNLDFGASVNTPPYANGPSNGNVMTGGIYGFNTSLVGTNRAFGAQPGGAEITPGSFQLRLQNMTGRTIRAVRVEYTIFVLNNANPSSRHDLRIYRCTDLACDTSDPARGVTIGFYSFQTPTMASAVPTWVGTDRAGTLDIDALPIADGEYMVLSWDTDDVGAPTGQRDEFALDDIRISLPECGNGVMDAGETCDDGDIVDETECPYGTATCTLCNATCTTPLVLTGRVCGDGTSDPEETCDDANVITETACAYGTPMCNGCATDCQMVLDLTGAYCGDSMIDTGDGETCDDGNDVDLDGCTSCRVDAIPDGGMPDAGMVVSDAGTMDPDAGVTDPDAGMTDDDAGREDDAGSAGEDGGVTLADGGPVEEEAGCGCSAPRQSSGAPYAHSLFAIAIAIWRARRKR